MICGKAYGLTSYLTFPFIHILGFKRTPEPINTTTKQPDIHSNRQPISPILTPPSLSSLPSSASVFTSSPDKNHNTAITPVQNETKTPPPKPTPKAAQLNTPPRHFSPSSVFSSRPRQLSIPQTKDRCPRCERSVYAVEKVRFPKYFSNEYSFSKRII